MEPGLELEHRSHLVQAVLSDTEEPEMAPTSVDGDEKRKPTRIEKEHHKQALAFYYSLGKDRTLAKVAGVFGVKESLVLNWSSAFGWKDRVAEFENISEEDEFKEKAMELLNLVLDSMSKREEETGKLILTSGEKVTVEKLKLCVRIRNSFTTPINSSIPDSIYVLKKLSLNKKKESVANLFRKYLKVGRPSLGKLVPQWRQVGSQVHPETTSTLT